MKENEALAIQLYLFSHLSSEGALTCHYLFVTIFVTIFYLGAVHLTLEGASVQPNVIESLWGKKGEKISCPPDCYKKFLMTRNHPALPSRVKW